METPLRVEASPVRIIKKGEKAPSDGVFYTKNAHAKLVSKIQTQKKVCQIEKDVALKKQKIQSDMKMEALKVALDSEKRKLGLTQALLKDQKKMILSSIPKRKTPWWKSPTFVFWSGFAAAIVVSGLATWGALELLEHKK